MVYVYTSEECVCVASGDPHYRQYDGNMVHFMGICKYTLSQTVGMLDECGFVIEVKNENRNGVTRVAYTRMVDVTVMGRTFRLLQGGKVEVGKSWPLRRCV